jgi:WD40 repeat protein
VPTGAEVLTLRGSRGEVFSVAFRPDGHQLAAGAADSVWVRLWDAGPPRKRPERHEGN